MAKKKKTRQQKIIADLRKQLPINNFNSLKNQIIDSDNFKGENKLQTPIFITAKKVEAPKSYDYLINDLKKTAILTSSIVALQLILYLLLTNRLLVLPGLNY